MVDESLVTTVTTVPSGRPFESGGEDLIIRLCARCSTKQHEVVLEVFVLINLWRGLFDNATCSRKGVNGVLKLIEHHRVIFNDRGVEHDRNFEFAETSLSCFGKSNLVAGRIHTSRTRKHRQCEIEIGCRPSERAADADVDLGQHAWHHETLERYKRHCRFMPEYTAIVGGISN